MAGRDVVDVPVLGPRPAWLYVVARCYAPGMLDHIGLQARDVEASCAFYLGTFAAIGMREAMRFPYGDTFAIGLAGPGGGPSFWLGPPTGEETSELHVAFTAPDRAAVDAVHQAAVAAGVEVLHAPREWPEYHPGYYAVFVRDPDGHNVEAVHHG
jgi:catechol 2,3-dioxygenase-like lactoylglutathione lyase family enzyme